MRVAAAGVAFGTFATFATVAFWSAIAAFVLAALMAVLVALGFWHARCTAADTRYPGRPATENGAAGRLTGRTPG